MGVVPGALVVVLLQLDPAVLHFAVTLVLLGHAGLVDRHARLELAVGALRTISRTSAASSPDCNLTWGTGEIRRSSCLRAEPGDASATGGRSLLDTDDLDEEVIDRAAVLKHQWGARPRRTFWAMNAFFV